MIAKHSSRNSASCSCRLRRRQYPAMTSATLQSFLSTKWPTSDQPLEKVSGSDLTLQLDFGILKPVKVELVQCQALQYCLTLNCQWSSTLWIASNCFYHLRRLRQIRRVIGEDVTSQLISAFALSLDWTIATHCSVGRPTTHLRRTIIQRVQNAAAHLVLNLGLRDHVTPALKL